MKKSEMRRILGAVGVTFALPENLPLEGAGDKILRRMEEQGQVWDPEEEPLPERLSLDQFGQIVAPRETPRHPGLTVREKREAVRRWNAWPELRASLGCLTALPALRARLERILDGKEGE